jgi:hypothetical protein
MQTSICVEKVVEYKTKHLTPGLIVKSFQIFSLSVSSFYCSLDLQFSQTASQSLHCSDEVLPGSVLLRPGDIIETVL